jgi:hypothetical protein
MLMQAQLSETWLVFLDKWKFSVVLVILDTTEGALDIMVLQSLIKVINSHLGQLIHSLVSMYVYMQLESGLIYI